MESSGCSWTDLTVLQGATSDCIWSIDWLVEVLQNIRDTVPANLEAMGKVERYTNVQFSPDKDKPRISGYRVATDVERLEMMDNLWRINLTQVAVHMAALHEALGKLNECWGFHGLVDQLFEAKDDPVRCGTTAGRTGVAVVRALSQKILNRSQNALSPEHVSRRPKRAVEACLALIPEADFEALKARVEREFDRAEALVRPQPTQSSPAKAKAGRPSRKPPLESVILWEGASPTEKNLRLARTRTAYLEAHGNVVKALEALEAQGFKVGKSTFYVHLDELDKADRGWRREVQLSSATGIPDGFRKSRSRKNSPEK